MTYNVFGGMLNLTQLQTSVLYCTHVYFNFTVKIEKCSGNVSSVTVCDALFSLYTINHCVWSLLHQMLLSSVEGWEESSVTQDEIGQRIVTALKRV